ncbi:response regulator [Halobacteriovorax sp. JY17]|uniref:response regulator n=1 Tax=Halobacteriovorax sp. JY17 TaxID=2014617 RepID=UPI000C688A1F|nr:response regulator [Halobacteriovorax sp. JY17]PIK16072.1 MAG: hypothetical protein CES88_04900 [Halobacteriovorax sp. JY17]
MSNSEITILIAEDEADLLEICTDIFEIEDFQVLGACNGEEALNIFLNNHVDLILSDSHMPKMGGLELLEKIQDGPKKLPPFFLLTGDIGLAEEELKEKGATGLISKPFDLDEILATVTNIFKAR